MNESTTGTIAHIAVEKALYSFDRLYSYIVPRELESVVAKGKRVLVPFGRGSRKVTGVIFALFENQELESGQLKAIEEVLDDTAYLNDELLALALWLRENTFCTYFHAVRSILPPVLRNAEGASAKFADKTAKVVRLSQDCEALENPTPKQQSVIETLENAGSASVKELCYLCGVSSAVVTNLVKKGILEEFRQVVAPTLQEVAEIATREVSDIALSPEQQSAFDALKSLLDSPKPECALLHGVTGSGKTSVFIKLVGECLAQGKTALVLVPEIALTPQVIGIFVSYFGDTAAVIHSGLSMSERTREYKRIRSAAAQIVLGTRSAVFSPLDNIGLIVIDEEGEHTYKSERSPRFHARDVAKQRCFRYNALLLLASATPSMDSYYRAKTQRYTLLELNSRYSGNALPYVNIVDMKLEQAMGNKSSFSAALMRGLRENLQRGEQSLLLLNRRGYHTFVCCSDCGEVAMCPHCAVALTLHKQGVLCCHYCAFLKQSGGNCGKCGSRAALKQSGTGTQRIEDELQQLLPEARILRMDADTTMTKGAYERGFGSFGAHEYDILLGTQMVAKGLDFPNVTLVGILLIDNSLYAGDYIGYERTFSLITQVVGRAGRGDKKGKAFLQTFTPDHYVLRLAARQDYRGFYEEEAAIRQTLLFPPFCDLCVTEICDVVEKNAVEAATAFVHI
ncbi:MAG: primosomal protein N', partial [Oscillospiraceae bacterium]|nr:primosomal protein N' [Oscillospiraceae bacterium]